MNENFFCNKCNEPMSRIVYGYPTQAMVELAEENEWVLGGCMISPIKFYCKNCKVSWSEDLGFDF